MPSSACLSVARLSRLRATAISSAPAAPMAPPSVGVATPRKMVPRTKKISASGGTNTNVTFSAMADNRFSLNTRFSSAAAKATPTPAAVASTMRSSSGRAASNRA